MYDDATIAGGSTEGAVVPGDDSMQTHRYLQCVCICLCVCLCVCVKQRERKGERECICVRMHV